MVKQQKGGCGERESNHRRGGGRVRNWRENMKGREWLERERGGGVQEQGKDSMRERMEEREGGRNGLFIERALRRGVGGNIWLL